MRLIKNWGFQWQRKYIFRGNAAAAGHLKGDAPGKRRADFKEQIGVYVLHDRNERIIYVGQAGYGKKPLFTRLKQHMVGRLADRWEYFTWFGLLEVNNDGSLSAVAAGPSAVVSRFTYSHALNVLEGILIEVIEPPLNKSGKLKEAREYSQVIDSGMKEVSNATLSAGMREIQRKLDKLASRPS